MFAKVSAKFATWRPATWIQQKIQDKAIEVDKISTGDNCADIGTKNLNAHTLTRFMKAIGIGYFLGASPSTLFVGCIVAQATLVDTRDNDGSHADSAGAGLMDDHWQFGLFEFMITTWFMMVATIWRLTRTTRRGRTARRTVGVQTDDVAQTLVVPPIPAVAPYVPRVFRSRRAGEVQHLFRDCGHLTNCTNIEETAVCLTCLRAARTLM